MIKIDALKNYYEKSQRYSNVFKILTFYLR